MQTSDVVLIVVIVAVLFVLGVAVRGSLRRKPPTDEQLREIKLQSQPAPIKASNAFATLVAGICLTEILPGGEPLGLLPRSIAWLLIFGAGTLIAFNMNHMATLIKRRRILGYDPWNVPISIAQAPLVPSVPRPPEVTRACKIFWVVLIASIAALHPAIAGQWWVTPLGHSRGGTALAIGLALVIVLNVTYGILVWLIGRGRNWARWALLVFAVSMFLLTVSELRQSLSDTPILAVVNVCLIFAELRAFRLLFFGPGAKWFRSTSISEVSVASDAMP